MEPKSFYDAFAGYYDLIFEDWEQSMQRQGAFIAELIARELPDATDVRVLDAAAGIGTQSLPLARAGFHVASRDLSSAAIQRLSREAEARDLA
jgi:2-polyprenyl-3-methyl-5-hydroxy-6-metoxy-1,4-benzoquinol methylase